MELTNFLSATQPRFPGCPGIVPDQKRQDPEDGVVNGELALWDAEPFFNDDWRRSKNRMLRKLLLLALAFGCAFASRPTRSSRPLRSRLSGRFRQPVSRRYGRPRSLAFARDPRRTIQRGRRAAQAGRSAMENGVWHRDLQIVLCRSANRPGRLHGHHEGKRTSGVTRASVENRKPAYQRDRNTGSAR